MEPGNDKESSTNKDNDNRALHFLLPQAAMAPQPPRVMSIQERKRILQSRRAAAANANANQQANNHPNPNPNANINNSLQLEIKKRRRSNTPIAVPALNLHDATRYNINDASDHGSSSRNNMTKLAPSLQSSQSSRYYSGNSQSHASGSLFANVGASQSQSQSTFIDSSQIDFKSREYDSRMLQLQQIQQRKARQEDDLLHKFENNTNTNTTGSKAATTNRNNEELTMFKSPRPNPSNIKPKTPSSLFGEIMKRTHWETQRDEVMMMEEEEGESEKVDDEINDFASAIAAEGKQLNNRFQPPSFHTMSMPMDDEGDDGGGDGNGAALLNIIKHSCKQLFLSVQVYYIGNLSWTEMDWTLYSQSE